MSQNDLIISNQSFPSFRQDLNLALLAIQTTHSGTTTPTNIQSGQIWLDTTSATLPILKYYDGVDNITLATINHTANTVDFNDSTVGVTGISTTATATVLTLSDTNILFGKGAYFAEATLTDGATITWNSSTQPVAKVTLGGNRTISAPTNSVAGQFIALTVIQDGTGSRTLTFNSAYEFTGDTAPTLTTTASKADLFVFKYNGTVFQETGRNLNVSIT